MARADFTAALYDYTTMEQDEILTSGVADMKEKVGLSIVAAKAPFSIRLYVRFLPNGIFTSI